MGSPEVVINGLKRRTKMADSTDSFVKIEPEDNERGGECASEESFISVLYQVAGPLLVSGLAMVGAGIYLENMQGTKVITQVPELIILVPALLGLKGNLEMTLASRLSTEANLGKMTERKEQRRLIIGNLALVQCQAVVVGLLSSLVAGILVKIVKKDINLNNMILLCASSVTTASIASFILGLVTVAIVIVSIHFNINPDNVTTPITASLGDITSLFLLSHISDYFLTANCRIPLIVIIIFLLSLPVWVYFSATNPYTKNVLINGWIPIIVAMLISTFGGLLLDHFIEKYKSLSAYQPVINGIGGNLVSIQASRLSTGLHQKYTLGHLPIEVPLIISPFKVFFSGSNHSMTSRVLLSLVVPGHLVLSTIITFYHTNSFNIFNIFNIFIVLYLLAALIQVTILLYTAYFLAHYFWKMGVNPDDTIIPYLTALGDLIGIILLGLVYKILY